MRVRKLLERESGDPGIGQPRWTAWSAAGTAKVKPSMNEAGKSDAPIVPEKRSNKASPGRRTAESVEGRGATKGNTDRSDTGRAQDRDAVPSALERVRIAAQGDRGLRFTTLWHHVYNVERLRAAYNGLKRSSAPGVDGVTWEAYAEDLESNLEDLSERLRRGAYRARPVQRVYIPKGDGRQRPIGIPALEDKIVQRATVEVLNAVYEVDFLGYSYGFRPKRSPHNALDALWVGITQRKVNWVLDADVSGFFDTINHEQLIAFVERRIADRRVVRHIKKWLKAGVLEDGEWRRVSEGTPQGGSVSPLLANVYLHYVLDVWASDWRQKQARGDVIVVRFADDFIVGFQYREDADRFRSELEARFQQHDLKLHPEKTRLVEFGRFAAERRHKRGEGEPETFDFLGFTHICGKTRRGAFTVRRQTIGKRLRAKLKALRVELKRRLHWSVREVGEWLRAVLTGHFRYYGVPLNYRALARFHYQVARMWHWVLRRRSQKSSLTWDRMRVLIRRWLPNPKIYHPWPSERLHVKT